MRTSVGQLWLRKSTVNDDKYWIYLVLECGGHLADDACIEHDGSDIKAQENCCFIHYVRYDLNYRAEKSGYIHAEIFNDSPMYGLTDELLEDPIVQDGDRT